MTTYNVTISQQTLDKFTTIGQFLGIKNADDCFQEICKMAIEQINLKVATEANEKFVEQAEDWMLHPSGFDGANMVLGPPAGMTEDEVHSLIAARIRWGQWNAFLSCWKPTQAQIDTIQATGRLWLTTMGDAMVPVCITSRNPTEFDGIELQ